MIRRIYMKVENHPDAERNCRLIDLCLTQPFHGDKYIKGGFSRHISRLVGICLQSIPITDDVVEYLETKCPDEIHRLISYGLIIDILISSEISNIEKRPLYDLISGRLYQNPDLNKITAPAESLFLVVLIHRTNSEHAKATFTELFPTLDKRKKLYADLTDQRYEVSFLKKLAGDP